MFVGYLSYFYVNIILANRVGKLVVFLRIPQNSCWLRVLLCWVGSGRLNYFVTRHIINMKGRNNKRKDATKQHHAKLRAEVILCSVCGKGDGRRVSP